MTARYYTPMLAQAPAAKITRGPTLLKPRSCIIGEIVGQKGYIARG